MGQKSEKGGAVIKGSQEFPLPVLSLNVTSAPYRTSKSTKARLPVAPKNRIK